MAVWTVFEPDEANDALNMAQWADKVVLVRERMSWGALLLAPLALLRYRLWLALILYCAAQGLIGFAILALEFGGNAWLLHVLPNLVVALGLPGMRRRKLVRVGYEETGAVVAPRLEAAEQRYFDARLSGAARQPVASWAAPAWTSPAPLRPVSSGAVLGLFPEAGR